MRKEAGTAKTSKQYKECWFLKFIQLVVIKDNAQKHKLWKKKSLHGEDLEFDMMTLEIQNSLALILKEHVKKK